MNKRNEKNQRHGPWEKYWVNGQLYWKGTYLNGIHHGLWESYRDNGKLLYKGSFINGIQIGYWIENNKTLFYL